MDVCCKRDQVNIWESRERKRFHPIPAHPPQPASVLTRRDGAVLFEWGSRSSLGGVWSSLLSLSGPHWSTFGTRNHPPTGKYWPTQTGHVLFQESGSKNTYEVLNAPADPDVETNFIRIYFIIVKKNRCRKEKCVLEIRRL